MAICVLHLGTSELRLKTSIFKDTSCKGGKNAGSSISGISFSAAPGFVNGSRRLGGGEPTSLREFACLKLSFG